MSATSLFRKPSAFLPPVMSLLAVLLVLAHLATVGAEPQADESAEARVWQLLMAGQLPLIAYFGVRWIPPAPRQGLIVLVTQLAFVAVAAAPVLLLRF
jgi:hypothetical protein